MAKRIEVIKSVSSVPTRKTRIMRQEELSCLSFFLDDLETELSELNNEKGNFLTRFGNRVLFAKCHIR